MNDNGAWTDRRDELLALVVRRGRARKLRRWTLGGAAVVTVAAVVAFGIAAASTDPGSSVRVQDPDGSTTTVPAARSAGVLLIGDSVMQGARVQLERFIPGARVDAVQNRRLDDVVPMLEAERERAPAPRIVVVHLRTNGDSDQVFEIVTNFMESVEQASTVYFLGTAFYDAVVGWPNAHVLDWQRYSSGRPWFSTDGLHLAGDGPAQYAQFIRDGIEPESTAYTDPFHGATVPATGFYVTSDPKYGGPEDASTSFAVRIVDEESGAELGELPRASIDSQVTNVARKRLVVGDDGIRLEAISLANVAGVPEGCTQTEANGTLAVALCGSYGGPNLLSGDRVIVNRGAGWQDLIAKPPGARGGHWRWASPSPDGQWVLAGWSGECEVPTSLFVRVADGAAHSVTGQPDISGPNSGDLGWSGSGDALAVFGEDNPGCGTAASVPRGVYAVSPVDGSRRLVLPLAPDETAIRWTAVDDRRTRPEIPGSPVRVDLDGDGRPDRLSIRSESASALFNPLALRASLADGRVVTGTIPDGMLPRVLGTPDIAGDGRHEVVVRTGGNTWELGTIVVLDGDRLVAITETPDGHYLGWGQHSNSSPRGTVDLACRVSDGEPALVVAGSDVTLVGGAAVAPERTMSTPDAQLERHWERWVYRLDGAQLVQHSHDSGVFRLTDSPPPGVPLANQMTCGREPSAA